MSYLLLLALANIVVLVIDLVRQTNRADRLEAALTRIEKTLAECEAEMEMVQ